MLRPVSGRSWVTARVCARNLWIAAVEPSTRDMSPSKAVDSTASETTAVVPPPIGRAAFGVYGRRSRMLSLRAITLSAPAEVATSTIDGSTAPSAGQAYSADGFTWRIVSTVDSANCVAGRRWLREPETRLPRCASDARSGSPYGSAITLSPRTASPRSSATAWRRPGSCPRRWCPRS